MFGNGWFRLARPEDTFTYNLVFSNSSVGPSGGDDRHSAFPAGNNRYNHDLYLTIHMCGAEAPIRTLAP